MIAKDKRERFGDVMAELLKANKPDATPDMLRMEREKALRAQISELESQKTKLGDPAYIAAQARERLGFVKPGDIPYQVQLPPGQQPQAAPGPQTQALVSTDPWYTAMWHTIADTPHGPPTPATMD